MRKTDVSALYAAYPHLAKLELLWGSGDGRDFINGLLNDTRGGTRQGFAAEHARTIVRLLIEHDALFPQFDDSTSVIWQDPDRRRKD